MKFTRFIASLSALVLSTGLAFAQVDNGKVTTAAPTYTNNTIAPLSLSTAGDLRVTTSGSGGSSTKVNCVYNTALPTYTNGQTTECQTDVRGNLSVAPALNVVTGADGVLNTVITSPNSNTSLTTGLRPPASAPWYFNGTTWDRVRGDTNGAYAQGNVASGVADAGNPVKIGGVYTSSQAALTTGQRGNLQLSLYGYAPTLMGTKITTGADGISNTLLGSPFNAEGGNYNTALMPRSATHVFNGATWDRNFTCDTTAIINVTAGTTAELVALSGSTITRVCSYAVTASANGTFKFQYGTGATCGTGTTDLTGAMAIAANDNSSLSSGNGSLLRTAAGNALCLAAVGGNMTGFVTYARY